MTCPKCGNNSTKNICTNCKTDIELFNKIDNISIEFYNKGLEFAQKNNITMAIKMLEKAVKYNKKNITAFNLLGLCYSKIGRITDASKYWILSCMVNDNNVAAVYLDEVEKNLSKREKINESIKMYNQGLIYVKQGSEDIAIIQLKKAVDLNSDLVDAHNLLALCYIMKDTTAAALKHTKRALQIDAGNEKALEYMKHLSGANEAAVKSGKTTINKAISVPTSQNINQNHLTNDFKINNKTRNNSIAPAIWCLVGAVCMYIFAFYVLMPSIEKDAKIAMEKQIEEYTLDRQDFDNTLLEKNAKIDELENSYNKLTLENEANLKNLNLMIAADEVRKANEMFLAKNYVDAAITISEIDAENVVGEDIDTYRAIREGSYGPAALELYNKAVKDYDNQLYDQSLINLERSVFLGGSDSAYYDDILYYMGRNYEGLLDNDTALGLYNRILVEHPNSDFLSSAQSRINVISQ